MIEVLPDWLNSASSLEYLYLDGNQIREVFEKLREMTQLTRLHVEGNPKLQTEINALVVALPGCDIYHDGNPFEQLHI